MATIVLDPGHGGKTKLGGSSANNATGLGGLLEKTVTLDVALRAEKLLAKQGHTVVLTRRSDHNLGLADRAKTAKVLAAPVFVSIHLNGFNNKVQGTETLCDTLHNSLSANLCRAVQKRMVAATGHSDRNASHAGGVKVQPLGVLKPALHHAVTACCLVEISFMDIAAEEARLRTASYLDSIAAALAAALGDYLAAAATEQPFARGGFEDGFAAEGGRATPLPDARTESAERPPAYSRAQKSAMEDRREFARVAIGDGFVPGQTEMPLAGLETPGFSMSEFRGFVTGLGLRYFDAAEFLFMGASNGPGQACAGQNHPPPPALWPALTNTARMLDEIRHRLGAPCRILSCYRSPDYNTCIGGESASLHMRFNAVDFRCETGNAAQWLAVARTVRASSAAYLGGIGKYASFVHIDTRGFAANW